MILIYMILLGIEIKNNILSIAYFDIHDDEVKISLIFLTMI